MESYNAEYVIILSGDHIYKMDYQEMLDFHKTNQADVTIAAMPVPIEEAGRFGIVITDQNKRNLKKSRSIRAAIWRPWVFTYSAGRY